MQVHTYGTMIANLSQAHPLALLGLILLIWAPPAVPRLIAFVSCVLGLFGFISENYYFFLLVVSI